MSISINPFRRRKIQGPITPTVPPEYYYTRGDIFSPGSQNLALESNLNYPLQGLGGLSVGMMEVTQPPQVYQFLALPVESLFAGIPVPGYEFDALTQAPNSDGSVQ